MSITKICADKKMTRRRTRAVVAGVIVSCIAFIFLLVGSPNLRLVGVHNDSMAIIENTTDGKQEVFDLGSTVFSDGQLVSVEKEKVIIEKGNSKVSLSMKQGILSGKTNRAAENIAGTNNFESSAALRLVPLEALSSKTVPVVVNRQIVGVQLKELPLGSTLAQWGLQNGDVIQSINGKPVRSTIEALDMIRSAANGSFSIEVERQGEKKLISVG